MRARNRCEGGEWRRRLVARRRVGEYEGVSMLSILYGAVIGIHIATSVCPLRTYRKADVMAWAARCHRTAAFVFRLKHGIAPLKGRKTLLSGFLHTINSSDF